MNIQAQTEDRTRKIIEAIQECDAYIAKEGPRAADLRPASEAQHLEFCKTHKLNLIAMLGA